MDCTRLRFNNAISKTKTFADYLFVNKINSKTLLLYNKRNNKFPYFFCNWNGACIQNLNFAIKICIIDWKCFQRNIKRKFGWNLFIISFEMMGLELLGSGLVLTVAAFWSEPFWALFFTCSHIQIILLSTRALRTVQWCTLLYVPTIKMWCKTIRILKNRSPFFHLQHHHAFMMNAIQSIANQWPSWFSGNHLMSQNNILCLSSTYFW